MTDDLLRRLDVWSRKEPNMYIGTGSNKHYIVNDCAKAAARIRKLEARSGDLLTDAAAHAIRNPMPLTLAPVTVQELLPWARLGHQVMLAWPEGGVDGFMLQDIAEKQGVIKPVFGGFDPEKHEDQFGCAEPGDDWFEKIKAPAVLRALASQK